MSLKPRDPSLRRHVEQLKHCVEEALSIVERAGEEDLNCALDDLNQASELVDVCIKRVNEEIRNARQKRAAE